MLRTILRIDLRVHLRKWLVYFLNIQTYTEKEMI